MKSKLGENDLSSKDSSLWSRYCWYLAASIAVVAVAFSGTELHALDRFGETFTSKLCEILPPPPKKEIVMEKEQEEEEEFNDAVVSMGEERVHNATYSKLDHVYYAGGRAYRAKEAMEFRYRHMKEQCSQYADKMRVESILHEHIPKSHTNFLYYPVKKFAFCQLPGVASKSNRVFFYSGEMGSPASSSQEAFKMQYPKIMKWTRNAIVVRHPLERILSVYRNTFEAHIDINKKSNQRNDAAYTFSQFVEIVLHGYSQLSEFLEQNNMDMGTDLSGFETGMVDGEKDPSRKWNSYWRECGVCHPDFQPQYIIHLENYRKDLRVIYEDWMEPQYWTKTQIQEMERFLNLKPWPVISSKPEALQHYYSQLTKSQIQALYEKYRPDHDLFGYTPEYFLALGKDE